MLQAELTLHVKELKRRALLPGAIKPSQLDSVPTLTREEALISELRFEFFEDESRWVDNVRLLQSGLVSRPLTALYAVSHPLIRISSNLADCSQRQARDAVVARSREQWRALFLPAGLICRPSPSIWSIHNNDGDFCILGHYEPERPSAFRLKVSDPDTVVNLDNSIRLSHDLVSGKTKIIIDEVDFPVEYGYAFADESVKEVALLIVELEREMRRGGPESRFGEIV